MKKGRHRRFEEARALKRTEDLDIEDLFDSLGEAEPAGGVHKPEHEAWSDLDDDEDAPPTGGDRA